MLLSRALSILLFSCITTGIASSKNIDNDDEDLSIQPNHPDVEDVVEAPPLAAMVKEAAKAAEVDINSLPLMDWRTVTPKDFWFEALALAFIGYYIVNYNSGKAKNKAVARAWLKCHQDTWNENCSQTGDDKGFKLTEDGPRDYIMFGTGRIHCKTVYGLIHLAPRHDLFQWLLEYIGGVNIQDRVTINVELNDEESDGIVMAVLPRLKAASITKVRWDLDNFAKPKDYPAFPKEDYVLLTDSGEFASAFWALEKVKKALWGSLVGENGKRLPKMIIEQITLSDLPFTEPEDLDALSSNPKTLQFIFSIPELVDAPADVAAYQTLLSEMVFDVIDLVGSAGSLSSDGKSKSKKLRDAAQAAIMRKTEDKRRQELADKKYAEKVAKEKAIMNLSPEAQRKAEEKLRKAEAKKQNKNRIKRVQQ